MTDTVTRWVERLDTKTYAVVAGLSVVLVALSAFQIMPPNYLKAWNAGLGGIIWTVCLLVVLGGRHVPFRWSATFALLWAGMTLTIPSMRLENPFDSPVYALGSTLSRLAVVAFVSQVAFDLYTRFKAEHGK